ncbi:MAG: PepSY domain-containing protein [Bacteroidota bacterium]|nr:PepSY domain-containing protein [Bacteroidota bacterium]
MAGSWLQISRRWHRKIASLLFIFFFFISLTGLMLGWKSLFSKTVFEDKQVIPSASLRKWLPLDSLETMASHSLNEKTREHFVHSERIELRPAKGYINFAYKKNYYIQVDGATGAALFIEQKNGGLIQDIHDGAIIDGWFNNRSGLSKKIYTTVLGLALLFLTISGFYLWYKPKQIKQTKNKA